MEVVVEKSHVAQVADELEKLGCTAEEADQLAREKHRALVDTLKVGRTTAGKIAEQIVEQETATPGAGAVGSGAAETAGTVNSANVGGISTEAQLDAFERTIPEDR